MNKEPDKKSICSCTDAGLFIPNRQVSFVIVGLIVIFVMVFIAAYFLGKQQAGITSSDASMSCDRCYSTTAEEMAETSGHDSSSLWYGELVGFGTKKAAEECAQRLLDKSYAVAVKERVGKTAKGRSIHWYQVVTEPSEYRTIVELVEKISHREHLTDAKIVAGKNMHNEGM